MTALRIVEPMEGELASPATPAPLDPFVVRLDRLLAELEEAAVDCTPVSDADRIDRIARLEKLRAATAGLQMAESVRFAQSQVEQQMAAGVHPQKIGRGVAEQIALACHVSPWMGARRLGVARALWFDLPETYAAVLAGALPETVAEAVVSETRHLDARTRRQVDARLAAADLTGMGYRKAVACARKHAYEADRVGYLARGRTERKHRRVGLKPAPDTMAILSGYLPVEQAAACYAALRCHAARHLADGDERTQDQIMADTMVALLTGQARAEDIDIEVQITVPFDSLLDPEGPMPARGSGTANLASYGPLPLDLAREIVQTSRGRKWWRRLFTAPSGQLVGGDPTRRRFDGWLARLISLRDQTCRDPFCDAPIRHHDHVVRWSDGGPTTYGNGRGTCARGNLVREMPGWQVHRVDTGDSGPHTVSVTTPTGHSYLSRAPDPP